MIAGVLLLIGLIAGGAYWVKDRLPSIASVIDSPKGVMKDMLSLAIETKETVDSIEDDASRDAAVENLKRIKGSLDKLTIRAAAFGPLSTQEYEELHEWADDQIPELAQDAKVGGFDISRLRSLYTSGLPGALTDTQFAFGNVASVIQKAWAPLPEPSNKREQVEHEILLVQRRAWLANLIATDSSEQASVAEINDATKDLQALFDEHQQTIESERLFAPGSPYFGKNFGLSASMWARFSNKTPLQDASSKFADVFEQISNARMTSENKKREDGTLLARENAMVRLREERDRARAGAPPMPPQSFSGGQRIVSDGQRIVSDGQRTVSGGQRTGPSRRPVQIDPALPTDQAIIERILAFRQRNSAEKTVALRIMFDDLSDAKQVRLQLQQALGLNRHFFSMFGDDALLLFVHDGPISEIIPKLTMGKVLSVNEAERTIRFEIGSR